MSFSPDSMLPAWLCGDMPATLSDLPDDVLLRIASQCEPEDAYRLSICNTRLHGLMDESYWQERASSMGAVLTTGATAVCQLFGVVQGFCCGCSSPLLVPWEDLARRGLPIFSGRNQGLFPDAVSHWILKVWFCLTCINQSCFQYISEDHLSIWHLSVDDLAGLPDKVVDEKRWFRYHDVVQRKAIKTAFLNFGDARGEHTLLPMEMDHPSYLTNAANNAVINRYMAEAMSYRLLLDIGPDHPFRAAAPSPAPATGIGDQTRIVPPGCANSNILPPELYPQYAQAHLQTHPWLQRDFLTHAQAGSPLSTMPVALATDNRARDTAGLATAPRPPRFFLDSGANANDQQQVWRHTLPLHRHSAMTAPAEAHGSNAGSSTRPLTASTSTSSSSRHGITATPETASMSLAPGETEDRKRSISHPAASPSDEGDGSPQPKQKKTRRPPAKTPEEKAAREKEKEDQKRLRAEERQREQQRKAVLRDQEKQRKAAEKAKEAERKAAEKLAQAGNAKTPAQAKKGKASASSSSGKVTAPRPSRARTKATPTPKKGAPRKRETTQQSSDSESQDQLAGSSQMMDVGSTKMAGPSAKTSMTKMKEESQGIRLPTGAGEASEHEDDGMSSALTSDDEDNGSWSYEDGRQRPDVSHLIGMDEEEARRQIIREVKRQQIEDALNARGFQMVEGRTAPEIEAWIESQWVDVLVPLGITCVEDVVQRLLDQFGPGAVKGTNHQQHRKPQQRRKPEPELAVAAPEAAFAHQHQEEASEAADTSHDDSFETAKEQIASRSRDASSNVNNVMNVAAMVRGAASNSFDDVESSQNTRQNVVEAERMLHLADLTARAQQGQQHQSAAQPQLPPAPRQPHPHQHFSPKAYGSLQGLIDADNVYGAYVQQATDLSHGHERRAGAHHRSHSQQQIQLQQQQQQLHRRTPSIGSGSSLLFGPGPAGDTSGGAGSSRNVGGAQQQHGSGSVAAVSSHISPSGSKSMVLAPAAPAHDASPRTTAARMTDQFEADSLAFSSSLLAAEAAAAEAGHGHEGL